MTGDKPQPRFVVVLGPSAVGKSTVVHRLRQEIPNLYFSVSMTTRAPRPGEVEGKDYFFVTAEEFQRRIDENAMLEWADIHGGLQRSGTPAAPIEEALAAGRPVLVEVDLVGARAIAKLRSEAETVFLAPPSWEVLVERLTSRGTESEDVIQRRLETAKTELEAKDEFKHVIVNDDLDRTIEEFKRIFGGASH